MNINVAIFCVYIFKFYYMIGDFDNLFYSHKAVGNCVLFRDGSKYYTITENCVRYC